MKKIHQRTKKMFHVDEIEFMFKNKYHNYKSIIPFIHILGIYDIGARVGLILLTSV
jgi:hypothetical protein